MKTTQEKIEIMQAFVDGETIEFNLNDGASWWSSNGSAEFTWNWEQNDYRIKQLSPLIIPWDAIKPEYKWAAKDADGSVNLYRDKPHAGITTDRWFCQLPYAFTNALLIQDPDNINWKDSLVERPLA